MTGKAFAVLLMPIWLMACASIRPTQSNPDITLVFPYGRYRHSVHLKITAETLVKEYSFEGLVETKQDRIQLVALSPFHTTLMTVFEDRVTGEVKTQSYLHSLEKVKGRFQEYYELIRELLILPLNSSDSKVLQVLTRNENGDPVRARVIHPPLEAAVEFSSYQDRIPGEIAITDPRFTAEIRVDVLESGP